MKTFIETTLVKDKKIIDSIKASYNKLGYDTNFVDCYIDSGNIFTIRGLPEIVFVEWNTGVINVFRWNGTEYEFIE